MVFCISTPPLSQYTAPLPLTVLLDTTQVDRIRYSGWSGSSELASAPLYRYTPAPLSAELLVSIER